MPISPRPSRRSWTALSSIERELGLATGIEAQLERLREEFARGVSADYAASRGEHFCGLLLAAYLDAEFVDAAECIVIGPQGIVDPESYALLGARLADPEGRYVVPGFYGRDAEGHVRTFSRGGSDVSGAIAARAANAALYENWTDVSGLLMADPRIVDNPRPMDEVTYAEIRELSYMGASVLHDEAMAPVREVGIPVNIRNTNEPVHPGTRIVAQLSPEVEKSTLIAGVAGKTSFAMISIGKHLMNREVGFVYRLLGVLEHHGVAFEHCPSSIDSVSVVVDAAQIEAAVGTGAGRDPPHAGARRDGVRAAHRPDRDRGRGHGARGGHRGEGLRRAGRRRRERAPDQPGAVRAEHHRRRGARGLPDGGARDLRGLRFLSRKVQAVARECSTTVPARMVGGWRHL